MNLQFSKKLLIEEMPKMMKQFSWVRINMMKSAYGTFQHQRRFDLLIHLALQVLEMKEMMKNAPSELDDESTHRRTQ